MALYRTDRNIDFWRQLKEGSDRFDSTGEILRASVVGGRYVFAPSADPSKEDAARAYHAAEVAKIAALVKDGSAAVTTAYADGGQHSIFAAMLRRGANLGVVSRPEALAYAGFDVTLVPARRPRPRVVTPDRLDFVKAEWRPDPAPFRFTIVKVRVADAPFSLAFEFKLEPLVYKLQKQSFDALLIVGAMPLRSATFTN